MATRRLPSLVSAVATGAGAVLALAVVVGVIGPRLFGWSSPFSTETVDRSAPVVLTEISDIADFHAATADFEIVVDTERDVKWVPDFVAGERVQYLAVGSIDAVVDFSGLTEEAIVFDDDTGTAIVVLPEPTFTEPQIDFDNSGVMNRDRGLLDRLGGAFVDSPTGEESFVVTAGDKMTEAVPATDLLARAEANTEEMLETLLAGVGVDDVNVVFERDSTV